MYSGFFITVKNINYNFVWNDCIVQFLFKQLLLIVNSISKAFSKYLGELYKDNIQYDSIWSDLPSLQSLWRSGIIIIYQANIGSPDRYPTSWLASALV